MEDLVPQDHILRQIDKLVDFSFVSDTVKDCYCPNNGRPGVDPELVIRMLLIGYLYNLSENRLRQEVTMHAEKRLFCHMTSFAVQAQLHEKVFTCTLLSPVLVWINHFMKTFTNLLHKSISDFLDKQKYFHICCVLSS